jgi:hypothetical protein
VPLCEVAHGFALGEILTDQAIGIFVEATLPGMVRCSEVEVGAGGLFDFAVLMELGAVVGGEGSDVAGLALDQGDDAFVQFVGCAGFEFADEGVFGFAFDHAEDAVVVVGADNGVDFPVAESGTVFGAGWTLGDVAFSRQDAAGIDGAVAFTALFAGLAQMGIEVAAVEVVIPDEAVDGFMADREDPVPAQPAGDLLGAPIQTQKGANQLQVTVGKMPVAARLAAPTSGTAVGLTGAIVTVVAAVAPDLAADGTAVSTQAPGYIGVAESLQTHGGNHISLFGGDLVIPHGKCPLLGGKERLPVSQITPFSRERRRVALSL